MCNVLLALLFWVSLAVAQPVISHLTPSGAYTVDSTLPGTNVLRVDGSGFLSTATVRIDNISVKTEYVSSMVLRVYGSYSWLANAGAHSVVVCNTSFSCSSPATFQVNPLSITSVSPNPAEKGEYIYVSGGTFFTASDLVPQIQLDGVPLATVVDIRSALLRATVPLDTLTGTRWVTVRTPLGSVVGANLGVTVYPPLRITTPSPLPYGASGYYYSQSIAATGGSGIYSWSVHPPGTAPCTTAGGLPPGLNLTSGVSGLLSGWPTQAGTFTFCIDVANFSLTEYRQFSLTIHPPVEITTASPITVTRNQSFRVPLSATGGTGAAYSWRLTSPDYWNSCQSLPTGVSLDPAGALFGTPTSLGTAALCLVATSDSLTGTKTVQLVVNDLQTYTVATSPAGLTVNVDGTNYTAPASFQWTPGTSHTVSTTSPQASPGGATRHLFSNWSDGGSIAHSITAPASGTTYTANFSTQFLLTTTVSPPSGGSIARSPISSDNYYASGTTVQLTANPSSGYTFSTWSGDVAGTANPVSVTMSAPRSVTANFVLANSITVTTTPPGLSVIVDGANHTSPASFQWTPGSQHTIATSSPQLIASGTVRHTFNNWSDGGAISHTVTAPSTSSTYTANFATTYLLTTAVLPSNCGSVVRNPNSSDGYYTSGASVQLTAQAAGGCTFSTWSGDATGTTNPASVTMSAPRSATANFVLANSITVTTTPPGLSVIVDGVNHTSPASFQWTPGSQHTIATSSPQLTASGTVRNSFNNWSDGGAMTHTVTTPSTSTTYTANFTTAYMLTTAVSPSNCGAVVRSPSSSDGYYTSGTAVQLTAQATGGCTFATWSGDAAGTSNPTTVAISGARTVTANFTPPPQTVPITVTTSPPGLLITVDGTTHTAPTTLQWMPSTSHTLSAPSPQTIPGSQQPYAFVSWSPQGGPLTQTVTAPSSPLTYTATFSPATPTCTYSLASSSASYPHTGGSGSVNLVTQAGCTWVVTPPGADWVLMQLPLTGSGPATIPYTVSPNSSLSARQVSFMVAGQSFWIYQDPFSNCQITFAPMATTFGPSGGSASVQLSADCAWTATSSASWLHLTSSPSGTGPATLTFTADATSIARSGSILVNGASHPVTQNAAPCTFAVSPTTLTLPAAGAAAALSVTPSSTGCGWTASSNAPWLLVTSGANGSVHGLVTLSATPNAGAQRSTSLLIAGQTVAVTQQAGNLCPVTLMPASLAVQSMASSGLTVVVNSPCGWTSSVGGYSWLRILSGTTGNGPGVVTLAVDPNTQPAARTASLTIAGQAFTVTQSAPQCTFALTPSSLVFPAAGATQIVTVNSCAGCSWSTNEAISWIDLVAGGQGGTGNGLVTVRAAPNPDSSVRNATITIAGRAVSVTQAASQSFACSVALSPSSPVRQVRSEGRAELVSDLLLTCSGSASAAIRADVLVKLNTAITSRAVNATGELETLLLINDPTTPVPGSNAFRGRLDAANLVRFPSIPLASAGLNSARTLRITNLRADAAVPSLPQEITATVSLASVQPVSVANTPLTVASRAASMHATFAPATSDGSRVTLPLTFTELLAHAFRVRVAPGQDPSQPGALYPSSESGYVHTAALGQQTGVADTATRLMVRFRNLPPAARILAPASPASGAGARLLATDATGSALGAVTDSLREVPRLQNEAILVWEITQANPAVTESLTFPIQMENVTTAAADALAAGATVSLGPLAAPANPLSLQPLPRFQPPGTVRPASMLVAKALLTNRSAVLSDALTPRSSTTGNRSAELQICTSNGGTESAQDTVLRGNLSSGSLSAVACNSGDANVTCEVTDRDVVLRYGEVDPGQTVTAVLNATLRDDAADGSWIRWSTSGSSDYSVSADSVEACFEGISQAIPQPPAAGANGSFMVYSCGAWTITSSVPWIVFNPASGTGNTLVTYTVQPNTAGQARTGTFSVPGAQGQVFQPAITNDPPPSGGLRFVPVPPCRILETRSLYAGLTWTGAFGPPKLNAGQTRTLPVAGAARCNIPATAKAFVFNVTVDTVEENTGPIEMLTIYPSGTERPPFGTIRTSTGGYIANSAIVKAGVNGAVDIYSTTATHVLIDVNGYFTDDPAAAAQGLLFYPYGPCRAVDTRDVYNTMSTPFGHHRMQSRETRTFRLTGSPGCAGLQSSSAYSLQMTLAPGLETNGSPVAYVTAWPTGQAQPIISNMNALFGYAVANSGIVPASANGSIDVFTFDATNVILDVNGYFAPDDGSGRGLYYFPVTQCRAVNTLDPTFPGAYGPPQMTPATDRAIPIASSPRCTGLPANAKAWALNATAIPNGVGLPFLSMWPAEAAWPGVSQLNAFQGQTVANSGIVPAGPNGAVQVKVNAPTHMTIEVAGYFSR